MPGGRQNGSVKGKLYGKPIQTLLVSLCSHIAINVFLTMRQGALRKRTLCWKTAFLGTSTCFVCLIIRQVLFIFPEFYCGLVYNKRFLTSQADQIARQTLSRKGVLFPNVMLKLALIKPCQGTRSHKRQTVVMFTRYWRWVRVRY